MLESEIASSCSQLECWNAGNMNQWDKKFLNLKKLIYFSVHYSGIPLFHKIERTVVNNLIN